MFIITVHHVHYHRAPCSVLPCTMFIITVHHVNYHRVPCSLSPCTMFIITVHHVQYHRVSCSVSPFTDQHLCTSLYTKSHITYSYSSNACWCCTKCTAHQFFAGSAVMLLRSNGAVRSQGYGKLECQYKSVPNKYGPHKSPDIATCTQIKPRTYTEASIAAARTG